MIEFAWCSSFEDEPSFNLPLSKVDLVDISLSSELLMVLYAVL